MNPDREQIPSRPASGQDEWQPPRDATGDLDWPSTKLRYESSSQIERSSPENEASRAEEVPLPPPDDALLWPPGLAGKIAVFLHRSSYSPIAEVSIASTLGLLAGVCGRAFRTYTGKDLALYIILVAKSGVGKDHMHEAIPAMLLLADKPLAMRFCRAQDFASGEALHKEVLRDPGFLYLQGEFGRKLKQLSNPQNTPMQTYRTVTLNAFGKRYMEGKSYSNAENTVDGVEWPALSFLGETTPGTFLECLTEDMMADGFLSRFLVISFDGGRPKPNRDCDHQLDQNLLAHWRALVDHALKFQGRITAPNAIAVQPDDASRSMLECFEEDCREHLNTTDNESERQVWSRAHIKALKIASLLAASEDHAEPVITEKQAKWAIGLVQRDVAAFQARHRSGDVGIDDDARMRKLASILRDYLLYPPPESYKVPSQMQAGGVVTRSYLQIRTRTLAAFKSYNQGQNRALDHVIHTFVANGYLIELDKLKIVEQFSHHGRAYRIVDLPPR